MNAEYHDDAPHNRCYRAKALGRVENNTFNLTKLDPLTAEFDLAIRYATKTLDGAVLEHAGFVARAVKAAMWSLDKYS
ncbi:hypothetical protein UCDDA912_g06959 [Diaporthe ampelina]|uniref:Uncharacterized protein n=1 Tax=Diaporthe ampelina TaxID=1214573 RepID=A0A0G2FG10_9PEZI|nr:hypothetical protein UCDDA912_g06959 [Diaporthe ampelina]